MNTVFGFSRTQGALFVAIAIALAVALMPQPAHSQVIAVPTFKAPSLCSGQLAVNTVDAAFCIYENTTVDLDKVVVYSPVPPARDTWMTSWRPTQMDVTILCVAKTLKADTEQSARNNLAPNMRVELVTVPAISGRACWLVQ
jgi:hypothetical protein